MHTHCLLPFMYGIKVAGRIINRKRVAYWAQPSPIVI
jgi:hypothetical protein